MDLEKRMEDLEKKLRTYEGVGIAVIGIMVLAIILVAVWPGPKFVTAEGFLLKDASGKPRGAWAVANDNPFMVMYDKNKKVEVSLGVTKKGSGLFLPDSNGTIRASFQLVRRSENERIPYAYLTGSNEKMKVALTIIDEKPALRFYDLKGKLRGYLSLQKKGAPILSLLDTARRPRMSFLLKDGDEQPGILLLGEKQEKLWSAPPGLK